MRRIGQLDRLLATATLIIGVYVAVSTIAMIVGSWGPLPVEDSWLGELVSGRDITWSWLISQHNEHRLVLWRLISIADYWLSAETNVIPFVAGVLMLASLGLLVVRLSRGAGLRGWVEMMWAAGLTLGLLFWAVQQEALIMGPPFVQFIGMQLAAAATFSVLALGPPTIGTLAIVIGLEFVSAYIMASGVMVSFLAIVLAIWLDRPRSHVAVLSVAAVSVVISYLVGYHTPPTTSDPLEALSNLRSILVYTAAYLGGPFGESIGWLLRVDRVAVAVVAGGAGILIFATLGRRLLRIGRSASPQEAVLFAFAGLAVAGGLLISFGRVGFGMEQALSSRYATQVLPFWLMLGLLGASSAIGSRCRTLAVMVFALPVLIVVAISEPYFAQSGRRLAAERNAAAPALLANVADPLLARLLEADPGRPLRLRPVLQTAHTSVFSEAWGSWLGTPLAEHVVLADASACQGSFDKAVSIIDESHPGWRAVGRAWSTVRGRAPRRIVLVDSGGLVTGYGLGGLGLDPEVVVASVPESGEDTLWIGAFTGSDPGSTTAYALLDEAPTACPLGRPRRIASPIRLVLSNIRPADLPAGGYIESVSVFHKNASLSGWGMLHFDDNQVVIYTNLPVKRSRLKTYARPDVVSVIGDERLANAGILVNLDLDESLPLPEKIELCVWTDDPEFGRHLLGWARPPSLIFRVVDCQHSQPPVE
jgi:hypothetical protein